MLDLVAWYVLVCGVPALGALVLLNIAALVGREWCRRRRQT